MGNYAFLFSGQGSQYPGMGRELYDHSEKVRQLYKTASDIFGFDVAAVTFEGDAQELAQTRVSQPIILTMSLAAYTVVCDILDKPCCVAGHSLGEYAALTAAGVMDIATVMQVVSRRAQIMQQAAESSDGAMYAVMGSDNAQIEEICRQVNGYVAPVNFNCTGQTVIAGESAAAQAAAQRLTENGARVVRLAVNAAFHSKLMEPAAARFRQALSGFSFQTPSVDFYSNITGSMLSDFSDMPGYLSRHLCSPVLFTKELSSMEQNGIRTFVELGPGKTLISFARKTLSNIKIFNVEDLKSLEKTIASLSDR